MFLVYAEKTVPSGLSSLVFAVTPFYVALIEMALPNGEPLPRRGWLGLLLGFAGLAVLLWPSLHTGLGGNRMLLWAIVALLAGALCWTVGSILSRHARLKVDTFVAASWQMVIAGAFDLSAGTALGQWPRYHLNAASDRIDGLSRHRRLAARLHQLHLSFGTRAGRQGHVVYLCQSGGRGAFGNRLLHERPVAAEFAGMGCIVVAVFLMTTAQVKAKAGAPQSRNSSRCLRSRSSGELSPIFASSARRPWSLRG